MAQEPDVLTPGKTFGRYTILRRIGAGGMGSVYEAQHVDLKKRVAIKALSPSMTEHPEARARFIREGEASARIRHQHVVDVYDVGFEEGIAFLVMELLEGEDLNSRLRREKPLAFDKLADIMLATCSAVHAAHAQGVIHRDLKPANIFLSKGPGGEVHPKVLDFGISKILADPLSDGLTAGLTSTGAVLGTPFYMSPEQAHGGTPLDARSDQYSLGVILYQCATGQRPFDAPSMYQVLHKIVQGSFDPPSKLRPEIPPEFERAILKAMARDPADRYSSVLSLGAALLPLASQRSRIIWGPTFADGGRSSLAPTSVPPAAEPLVEARALAEPLADSGPVRSNTFGVLSGANTGLHAPSSGNKKLIFAALGLAVVGGGLAIYLSSRDSAVISVPLAEQAPRAEPARSAVAPAPSASPSAVVEASPSPSAAVASPVVAPAASVSPAASAAPASPAASTAPKATPTPKPSAVAAKPAAPVVKPAASPKSSPAAGANNAPIIE